MAITFKKILKRLRFEIWEGRQGYGKPVGVGVWDRQFSEGEWKGLTGPQEAAHYAVIAGYLPFLHPKPAVLDAGCGQGVLAGHVLQRPCERYLGIDISREAVDQARLHCPQAQFEEGCLETFTASPEFDVIILNESIYYTRDPLGTFQRLQAMLRLPGAIIVSMCEYGHNKSIWGRLEQWSQPVWATRVSNEIGQGWNIKVFRFGHEAQGKGPDVP